MHKIIELGFTIFKYTADIQVKAGSYALTRRRIQSILNDSREKTRLPCNAHL